ncbi:hypothetical protein APX70_03025, partial [Pseudomonas syringae pv. maculicola]
SATPPCPSSKRSKPSPMSCASSCWRGSARTICESACACTRRFWPISKDPETKRRVLNHNRATDTQVHLINVRSLLWFQ